MGTLPTQPIAGSTTIAIVDTRMPTGVDVPLTGIRRSTTATITRGFLRNTNVIK